VGAKCDGEGEGVKVDGEEEGAKGDDERHGAMGEVDVPEPLADLMRRFDRVNMAATFLQMQRAPVPTVGVLQAACPDVSVDLASLVLMARLCPRALCLAPSELRDERDDHDRGSPRPTGAWRVHVLDPGKGGRPEADHRMSARALGGPRAGMEGSGGAAMRRSRCFRERCLEAAAAGRGSPAGEGSLPHDSSSRDVGGTGVRSRARVLP